MPGFSAQPSRAPIAVSSALREDNTDIIKPPPFPGHESIAEDELWRFPVKCLTSVRPSVGPVSPAVKSISSQVDNTRWKALQEHCKSAAILAPGMVWVCRPGGVQPYAQPEWAEAVAQPLANLVAASGTMPPATSTLKTALVDPWEHIDSGYATSVLIPEACEELQFCCWDGDGHYDTRNFSDFEPPTLGQIMMFLRMVEKAVACNIATVHFCTEAQRAKATVLAGAVLVLLRGYSADAAWAELGKIIPHYRSRDGAPDQEWDKFPLPFGRSGRVTSETSLRVRNCLEGLETAAKLGWLERPSDWDYEKWKLLRCKFDCSWIIPGDMLGFGDPVLTAQNPDHPELYGDLDTKGVDTPSPSRASTSDSLKHTSSEENVTSSSRQLQRDSFDSLFGSAQIGCVIRLNKRTELRHYDLFKNPISLDIPMLSREFEDQTVPPLPLVRAFLEDCAAHRQSCGLDKSRIAVHCKAGLGRTSVMIGAYAMANYPISGKAFHGWIRMCRPGSVQTPGQEAFLRQWEPGALQPERLPRADDHDQGRCL